MTKAGFEADQFRIPYFSTLLSKTSMSVGRNCFILPFWKNKTYFKDRFFNEWGMHQMPSTNIVLVLTTLCTTLNSGRSRMWLVPGVNRHLPCSRLGARLWRRKKRTSGRCCPHRWRRSNILSPSPTARSVKNLQNHMWKFNIIPLMTWSFSNYNSVTCADNCRVNSDLSIWN